MDQPTDTSTTSPPPLHEMRTCTSNRGLSHQHGIMAVVLLILLSHFSTGFVMPSTPSTAASRRKILQSYHRLRPEQMSAYMSNSNDAEDEEEEEEEYEYEREPVLVSDVRGRPAGVVLDDLNWRVQRLKLEEANTRRFLKSGPRFLPYEECRKWVQAWGLRWTTAEEWCVLYVITMAI